MDNPIRGLWVGERLSLMEKLSIRSFLANGHTFELYVYDDVSGVPEGTTLCDANTVIPESEIFRMGRGPHKGSLAAFANMFRYKLICEKGGFWSDVDVVCVKPFSFSSEYVFSSERRLEGQILANVGIFKSPKGAPFLQACNEYCQSVDPKELKWTQTGAQLAAPLIHKFNLDKYVVDPKIFSPLDWWDAGKLIESGFELDLNGAYAIHLWNECWRVGEVGSNSLWQRLRNRISPLKERRFGTDTLLGRLQAKYFNADRM